MKLRLLPLAALALPALLVAAVPAGFARNPANEIETLTLGVNWKPIEQLIFKADWQDVENGADTGVDQFNLSLGYIF